MAIARASRAVVTSALAVVIEIVMLSSVSSSTSWVYRTPSELALFVADAVVAILLISSLHNLAPIASVRLRRIGLAIGTIGVLVFATGSWAWSVGADETGAERVHGTFSRLEPALLAVGLVLIVAAVLVCTISAFEKATPLFLMIALLLELLIAPAGLAAATLFPPGFLIIAVLALLVSVAVRLSWAWAPLFPSLPINRRA